MEDLEYDSRQEHEIYLFYETSGPVLGPSEPPIKWTFGVLLPTAVWPGLDAAHSPPFIAEFIDEWSYVPASPMACTWTAIKFTFNVICYRSRLE
jgi:hypothetical protein